MKPNPFLFQVLMFKLRFKEHAKLDGRERVFCFFLFLINIMKIISVFFILYVGTRLLI